ncbi:hypothetical protein TNCV_2584561 [Trichonephila clavipes]|nr:hypothetical protein TNCV_2584561 [Trichonephila clavipes]
MAERSKALRSGRSPLVWAWVPKLNVRENPLHVRMADRSKARSRSCRSPLLWAWVPKTKFKLKLFHMSGWPIGLRRCVEITFHFCGRGMAKRSKALRSCHSPSGFGVGSNATIDHM